MTRLVNALFHSFLEIMGWSGGAMVLAGLLSNLDNRRARVYCACSGCGWGFRTSIMSLFFLPLSGRRPNIDGNTVSKGRY